MRHVVFFVCLCSLAVQMPDAVLRASDVDDQLRAFLKERRNLTSYDASLSFVREAPTKIQFRIRALLSENAFRLDQTWLEFEPNPDQVGREQEAARVGTESRTNSNRTGAMLDFPDKSTYAQLDLRRLGMLTSPFMNMQPTEDTERWGGLVSQFLELDQNEDQSSEMVHGERLTCYRKRRSSGSTIGMYFDRSGTFRGCDVRREKMVYRTFFERMAVYSGVSFPSGVIIESWEGAEDRLFERVIFESIEFGAALNDADFAFSGLGVAKGSKVTIGSEFTNAERVRGGDEMIWNGEKLLSSDTPAKMPRSSYWSTYVSILGVIILCVFAFRILRVPSILFRRNGTDM